MSTINTYLLFTVAVHSSKDKDRAEIVYCATYCATSCNQ